MPDIIIALLIIFLVMIVKFPWASQNSNYIDSDEDEDEILHLDHDEYIVLEDIRLPLKNGSFVTIDRLYVSPFGIFVLKTFGGDGEVFGTIFQKKWTWKEAGQNYCIPNPIHVNEQHIMALQGVLNLPFETFIPLVVFEGECEHKSKMIDNVFTDKSYIEYIQMFTEEKLNFSERQAVLKKLSGDFIEITEPIIKTVTFKSAQETIAAVYM